MASFKAIRDPAANHLLTSQNSALRIGKERKNLNPVQYQGSGRKRAGMVAVHRSQGYGGQRRHRAGHTDRDNQDRGKKPLSHNPRVGRYA